MSEQPPVKPFAHLDAPNAELYRRVMGVFVAAKRRFLVLAWRGRERDDLLTRLRGLRALTAPAAGVSGGTDDGGPDRGAIEDPPLAEQLDRFWSPRGDLTACRRGGGTAAAAPDILLRGLEPPDVQLGGRGLEELLVPAYHAMARARVRTVGAIEDTSL